MATIVSNSSGYWFGGNGANRPEYVHHNTVDGDTKYGGVYSFPRRAIVGAYWEVSILCGSRCTACNENTARTASAYSACMILYNGNDC